jgi:integrase
MTRRSNGEGSVRQRKDGRWEARLAVVKDGKTTYAAVYGKTRAEAVEKLRDLQKRREAEKPLKDSAMTVSSWAEVWYRHLAATGRRQGTIDVYRSVVDVHVVPAFGSKALKAVKPSMVEQWLHELGQTYSQSMQRKAYAVMNGLMALAVRDGLIATNPVSSVARPKQAKPKQRALTPDEVRRVLDACSEAPWGPLVALIAATGLRRSEASGLLWEDVRDSSIVVSRALTRTTNGLTLGPTKSEAGQREVPLPDWAVKVLRQHRKAQAEARLAAGSLWQNQDLVFTTELGLPIEPSTLSKWYRGIAAQADVSDSGLHALRHFAATQMLSSGATVRDVADLLGHSSPVVTLEVYAAAVPESQRKAVDAIAEALGR